MPHADVPFQGVESCSGQLFRFTPMYSDYFAVKERTRSFWQTLRLGWVGPCATKRWSIALFLSKTVNVPEHCYGPSCLGNTFDCGQECQSQSPCPMSVTHVGLS